MNLTKNFIILLTGLLLLLCASCSTPLSELVYLNHIETGKTYLNAHSPGEYRIQPNDQLFIQVISDDPMNAAFLNIVSTQGGSSTMGSSTTSMELITFLVNEQGKIDYPQLGEIKVVGLTTTEVSDLIQEGVDAYLEGASVFVKLVNRTITVLGEVSSPGQKTMVKNQLSIFEALGAAGDITDWGNRRNVKLIRELPEGKHIEELDITDPKLIDSPFYYVLPHDIIYVEHNSKVYGAKNLSYTAPLSIVSTLVTIIVLVLTL